MLGLFLIFVNMKKFTTTGSAGRGGRAGRLRHSWQSWQIKAEVAEAEASWQSF